MAPAQAGAMGGKRAGVLLSILISVVAAFAAITLIAKYQHQSATALGKVGAVMSATAAFAEAWSKTTEIARRHASSPTEFHAPQVPAASSSLVITRPAVDPLRQREVEREEFFDENPSFRTGGIRGYDAYRRP